MVCLSQNIVIGLLHIPTGSRTIGPPNSYKYWWLRSPDTYVGFDYGGVVWSVTPDGDVVNYYNSYVDNSYGRKKIAVHMAYHRGIWCQLEW